jgi:hypothetical protein
MEDAMAKTYNLQGPIVLENLTNTEALSFIAAVVAEVPAHSMGTASMNLKAEGPAGSASTTVEGNSLEKLKASLAKAQAAPKTSGDIVYHVRGRVNLIGLSLEEGIDMIDTTMRAIPNPDALVVTAMLAQEETP